MSTARTPAQSEANAIDMEMHRLAGRIERFAQEHLVGAERGQITRVSDDIFASRSRVRRFMHRADQEDTK